MKNAKLIINYNKNIRGRKPKINRCRFVYKNNNEKFDGFVIKKVIAFINAVLFYYPKVYLPIHFDLGKIKFEDKLTFVIFETLCYVLITEFGYTVTVSYTLLDGIAGEGGRSSPLLLLERGNADGCSKFVNKYRTDLYKNHYRNIIRQSEDSATISKELGNIKAYLEYSGVEKDYAKELSIMTAELIANALEHGDEDCLFDIDVTNSYFSRQTKEPYCGINIVVINCANNKIGDALKMRLQSKTDNLPENYQKIIKAYDVHCVFFDDKYQEEDFYNLAAFQHKISGNVYKIDTGGTGLTTLLQSVEKRAETHYCYCLSGNRGVRFIRQQISRNQNGVGFNQENDFYHHPPSEDSLTSCPIYIPGTAYNLTFVVPRNKEAYI